MLSQTRATRRTGPAGRNRGSGRLLAACIALIGMLLALSPAPPIFAQDNPSGLTLPRFASTRSSPINVRVGPGTRYEIAWVYLRPGLPVEIIQEFDTWRKIRDVDGEEGWVHQNLLTGTRIGYVTPWDPEGQTPLMGAPRPEGSARAILGGGFRVGVSRCDGEWCAVSATHQPEGQRAATYTGFVAQEALWGVYGGEVFD